MEVDTDCKVTLLALSLERVLSECILQLSAANITVY